MTKQSRPKPKLTREQLMDAAAARANAEMNAANARPIPRAAYEVEPSLGIGGSAGFSRDGNLWSEAKSK